MKKKFSQSWLIKNNNKKKEEEKSHTWLHRLIKYKQYYLFQEQLNSIQLYVQI